MSTQEKQSQQTEASAMDRATPEKKQYSTPKLRNFGKLHRLTQGASGSVGDGTGMLMAPSERHLKENIVRVGQHPLGFGLYVFDYKPSYRAAFGESRQFGVMADEVEAIIPEAVLRGPDGLKRVNYTMLGIARRD